MTRRRIRRFALTVCLALIASSGLLPGFTLPAASALPAGFQVTTVFSGLNLPTAIRFSSDGRVFVAEKHGLVKVFDDLSDTTPTVFADLSTEVHSYLDRGLLGLALHPSFPAVPYVYVAYTHDAVIGGTAPRWGTPGVLSDPCPDPPGGTTNGCVVSGRLSRLTADGNQMSAEQVLVEDWCQQFPSHSIGTVAFGPDGALYAGSGDGAITLDWGQRGDPVNPCGDPPGGVGAVLTPPTAEGGSLRSQDLRTSGDPVGLSGTIIRVDPMTGDALPDNPMYSSADPNQRRIVTHGLRNPFRFTFRPGTSEIWAGDTGERLVEEIDRIPVGDAIVENHGWPCYEGSPRQPSWDQRDFTICEQLYAQPGAAAAPFYSYRHGLPLYTGDPCSAGQSAVSSIAFYEGGSYPDAYDGALFFGDYGRDCIWVMLPNAPNGGLNPSSVEVFFESGSNPVDIQVGPGGDLFFLDVVSGRVRRIGYFGIDQPPVAAIDADRVSGPAPLTVNFDGSGSSDPEGGALAFAWDLDGDGAFDDASTPTASWTYEAAADTTVRLRVTDPGGQSNIRSIVISVANDPPVPVIDLPTSGFTWHVGEAIDFSGHATDPDEGPLPASALSWTATLQHCDTPTDCHAHVVQEFDGQASGSFAAPDHEYPVFLDLELTATDSRGLAVSTTVRLSPETTDVTMASNPPGLQLGIGLTTRATPFTHTVIVGSTQSITAPTPQSLGSTPFDFVSWSDGGARTHEVVVNGPSTFSATFQGVSASTMTVSDFVFQPKNAFPPIGGEVRWNFTGPSTHTVTDNTGMGLYDSGSRAPGSSFSYAFPSAGNFPFRCTIHPVQMRGSVQIPVSVSPTSGGVGTPFSITWASGAPPSGYVYDVQIRRAGSSVWQYYRQATTTTSAVFTPDAGVGAYSFQARIRQVATARAAAFSTPVSIDVA